MVGTDYPELREVMRTAAGVVRTAHPEKIREAVVAQWWTALVTALIKAYELPETWSDLLTDPDNESRCP